MIKRYLLALIMGLLSGHFPAQAAPSLQPSHATRPGEPSPTVDAVSLQAQTIELTLSDAIYLGLRNNRAIRSAYLDRVAQKFSLYVAEDRFTPKLMLNSTYRSSRNQSDRLQDASLTPTASLLTPYGTRVSLGWAYHHNQAKHAGWAQNDGANIAVIQPLLRGAGKDIATAPVRQAQLAEQINRLNLKSTVSGTITQIIASYRALLQAQEQVKIMQDSLDRAHRLIEVNRALIAAGRMAEFEIVQAEAGVASQELSYEETRHQLDMTRLALLQLLALDLHTPIVAADALRAERIDIQTEQALQEALSSQPSYLSQLIAREQIAINRDVANNDQLWDVSLIAGASQARDRGSFGHSARSWNNYIGLQVEIPIGDPSRRQAQVQAEVSVNKQDIQLAEARQQLTRDVTNATRNIATRWRQYEIAQRSLELSRRKLDIEREKLAVGRSSNFQVLSFENDLRNAENSRLNALISYLNAQAELDQTLGTTLQSWDISLNDD